MRGEWIKLEWFAGKRSSERGFTIIELMTVVIIITVLTLISIANYHKGNLQVVLDMQANQFAQDVRRAQEWAMAAHQIGGSSFAGYGVHISAGISGVYDIFTDNVANGYFDGGDAVRQTANLDGKIEMVSGDSNPVSIVFLPPNPTTDISNDSATQLATSTIIFRLKGTSAVRHVTINRAGLIYVE